MRHREGKFPMFTQLPGDGARQSDSSLCFYRDRPFSVKGQIVTILGFLCHMLSVATASLAALAWKQPYPIRMSSGYVQIRTDGGLDWIWFADPYSSPLCSLLSLFCFWVWCSQILGTLFSPFSFANSYFIFSSQYNWEFLREAFSGSFLGLPQQSTWTGWFKQQKFFVSELWGLKSKIKVSAWLVPLEGYREICTTSPVFW